MRGEPFHGAPRSARTVAAAYRIQQRRCLIQKNIKKEDVSLGKVLEYAAGPLWFRDSGQRFRIKVGADFHLVPRAGVAAQRLQTIEVNWGTYARAAVLMGPEYPAQRTVQEIKIYHVGQRLAPLPFLCLEVN